MNRTLQIASLEELPQAAAWIESLIAESHRTIIALRGEMGVGKTTLVAQFCLARGIAATTSPTFSIVNEYKTPTDTIYHFDFYRITSTAEAMDIGIFDYLDSGNICFVEWPERIEAILAQCDVLWIDVEADSTCARSLRAEI